MKISEFVLISNNERSLWRKGLLSDTKRAPESRRHITKGGYHALDDMCDIVDTMAIGVLRRLRAGRVHPHSARHCDHCSGGRPYSEAKGLARVEDPETWMNNRLS